MNALQTNPFTNELTRREQEVVELVVKGLTSREIAQQLGCTKKTVQVHRYRLMKKLNVSSVVELVRRYGNQVAEPTGNPVTSKNAMPDLILVEDDPDMQEILSTGLNLRGFEVRAVSTHEEFNAAWQIKPADIVLLDVMLDDGIDSGFKITEHLRQTSNCGIIIVTALANFQQRLKGRTAGADHYFIKPVNLDELSACIENLHRRVSS
jgi:DNA-binding NarL/FixJ family response regulator